MFKKIPASSIPPLIFQLLKYVKNNQSLSKDLLKTINNYFSTKLSPEDRDGTVSNVDLDSIELVSPGENTVAELLQAESTVVFHINQAANNGHIIGKEIINLIKAGSQAPELVLTPFVLFLSLSFISIKQYQDVMLGCLKTAIVRAVSIEEARQNNIWTRGVMNKMPDIGDLLSLVITQSKKSGGWDLILQGILDLGLILLDAYPISKADIRKFKTIHNIGARLLLKLIKKQRECSPEVISSLTNKILTSTPTCIQYTEALRIVVAESSTILMETPHVFNELVENLSKLPFNTSRRCLYAMLPLVKLSRVLRDLLILALRKLLFASSTEARQAATAGVLMLLKTFRISTSRAVSQLSQSSGSLSQVAVDVHRGAATSNEALCLELLGVLQRCFKQQCEVKIGFYHGIVEVVNKNPELCEGTLELAHSHLLSLWGPEGHRNRWQLNLEKIVKESEDSCQIVEPVGWFISCLQLIVSKSQQVLDEESDVLEKVVKLLDEMVTKYGDCEPGELGFDVTDNFDKKTRHGEKNMSQVEQLKCLLESLMEYVFSHGADRDMTKNNQLLNLFNTYCSFDKLVSTSLQRQKAKKGEKGKNDKKDPTQDVSNESSKNSSHYSPPLHCFSLKCLSLLIKGLLTDTTPSHQECLEKLRDNDQFSDFILVTLSHKLKLVSDNLVANGDEGAQADSDFRFLLEIMRALFDHAITMQSPQYTIQKQVTGLLLTIIQTLLPNFPRRKFAIVSSLIDKEGQTDTDAILLDVLLKVLAKMNHYLGRLEDPDEDDIPYKLSVCLDIFKLLLEELTCEEKMEHLNREMKDFNSNISTDDVIVLKSYASLLFYTILKYKRKTDYAIDMAKKIHCLSGDLDSTIRVEQIDKPSLIWLTDDNKYHILPFLFSYFDEHYNQVEIVISWVKSLASYVDAAQIVLEAERKLSFLLCKQVNALTELIKTTIPIGAQSDSVMKLLIKQYTITDNLAKHLIDRSKKKKNVVTASQFDQLIKSLIKHITKNIDKFIDYVDRERDANEKEESAKRAAKQKVLAPDIAKAKVLRDSRLAATLKLRIETLDSTLIKLGKRVKDKDLYSGPKMQNKDFKLRLDRLQTESGEDESGDDENEEEQEDEDDSEGNDNEPTPVHHSTAMGDITNASVGRDTSEPVRKKLKKKL